ncbi:MULTISPECIES: glutamate-cysteine ligase family protein [unclassified Rhodococcus (in: high G+C Gram-positive bacteria)]|uniref:glutamate-cysteine ligase family protein n=1 Tax=unclassified Rhodococcus (in: high G+C Gram-positive bacteria) TaxID=192944 RepID=UPI0021C74A31|nr:MULTISPECIES: glutamate-cysteine ligase family protein [unclassified Rhodococcus (in: high G+C Gram-positive bacteria)]
MKYISARVSITKGPSAMPNPRPTLTIQRVHEVAREAFASDGTDLVGIEVEWPVHKRGSIFRPTFNDLLPVMNPPLPNGSRITIEPGGQIELSGQPTASGSDALRAIDEDAAVLHHRLAMHDLVATDLAVDDRRPPHRILDLPRYRAMENFYAHRGREGTWMMTNTASVQVNISHLARPGNLRWDVANKIGPLLIAAFANSPGIGPDGNRWQSLRQAIWDGIDPRRTAPVLTGDQPEIDWAHYALMADVFYIQGEPEGLGVPPGLTFIDWMTMGHPSGWPTESDLRYHLTTLFPPIRPRGWLEFRMIDALPPECRAAAILVVAGSMEEKTAEELYDVLPDTRELWTTAARDGLNNSVLRPAAQHLLETVELNLRRNPIHASAADTVATFIDRYTSLGLAPAHMCGDIEIDAFPLVKHPAIAP